MLGFERRKQRSELARRRSKKGHSSSLDDRVGHMTTSATVRKSIGDGSWKPRIAIAGFQHETNTFSPIPATLDDFIREDSWPGLTRGEDIFRVFENANIPIGGFIARAASRCELIPVLWASAEPSNVVDDEAFEAVSGQIIDGFARALPLDGIFLDLHGAMVTESFEDGEGEFLRRVRHRIGSGVPIVSSLDFHANLTRQMIEHADIFTIFRTYPHLDMAETGGRAATLLLEAIEERLPVRASFRKLPFLAPLQAQCTDSQPLNSIFKLLQDKPSLRSCASDIALGFHLADIADCGPCAVAFGFEQEKAEDEARRLEAALLSAEGEIRSEMLPPREAARIARRKARPGKPVVLADVQDNSGAGATSDTTGLLSALAEENVDGAVLGALCDPQSVELAHEAGIGAEIRIELGGKLGGADNASFDGRFRVIALSDGNFEFCGKMMDGFTARIGPTAALELLDYSAGVIIVATSQRIQCLDRAVFKHLGIEPSEYSVVAVKSSVHFRADFESLASEIVLVEAPGGSPCRLDAIEYIKLRPGVRLL